MESKGTFPRKTSLRIFLLSSILTWYQSPVLDFWSVRIIFFSLGFVGFSCSAHSGFHLGGVLLFSASSVGVRFLLLFPVPFSVVAFGNL